MAQPPGENCPKLNNGSSMQKCAQDVNDCIRQIESTCTEISFYVNASSNKFDEKHLVALYREL